MKELPTPVKLKVAHGATDITAVPLLRDEVTELVREHGSLYDWAATQPQARALQGRAPVYVATLPASRTRVVVRHAWHGGLLAPITGDRFRWPSRAPTEMLNSMALRNSGIPSTEVLGFVRYAAGPGLVRVDVFSRYESGTNDLGMILAGLAGEVPCEPAIAATRALLLNMAAHHTLHPDLNVKNILLRVDQVGKPEAMVIDVDVIRWRSDLSTAAVMESNVARLTRSIRKWRRNFGCDFSEMRLREFADATMKDLRATEPA